MDFKKTILIAKETLLTKEILDSWQNGIEEGISKAEGITKESLNLGKVDNTSDLDKPISTETKNYIDSIIRDIVNDLSWVSFN